MNSILYPNERNHALSFTYFLGNCLKEKDAEEFRGIFEVFDSVQNL